MNETVSNSINLSQISHFVWCSLVLRGCCETFWSAVLPWVLWCVWCENSHTIKVNFNVHHCCFFPVDWFYDLFWLIEKCYGNVKILGFTAWESQLLVKNHCKMSPSELQNFIIRIFNSFKQSKDSVPADRICNEHLALVMITIRRKSIQALNEKSANVNHTRLKTSMQKWGDMNWWFALWKLLKVSQENLSLFQAKSDGNGAGRKNASSLKRSKSANQQISKTEISI